MVKIVRTFCIQNNEQARKSLEMMTICFYFSMDKIITHPRKLNGKILRTYIINAQGWHLDPCLVITASLQISNATRQKTKSKKSKKSKIQVMCSNQIVSRHKKFRAYAFLNESWQPSNPGRQEGISCIATSSE